MFNKMKLNYETKIKTIYLKKLIAFEHKTSVILSRFYYVAVGLSGAIFFTLDGKTRVLSTVCVVRCYIGGGSFFFFIDS